MAWLIAFISSILAVLHGPYPNYSWWSLAYMFVVIIGVVVTVAADAVHTYSVSVCQYFAHQDIATARYANTKKIVGFLAAGLVFTTSSVNNLIYSGENAHEAAAAGFILLSMVAIVWMAYYGAQPSASHRGVIDSYALQKETRTPSRTSRHMPASTYRPETTISQQPRMYTSAQLSGFETSSPVTGFPGGAVGAASESKRNSQRFAPSATLQPQSAPHQQSQQSYQSRQPSPPQQQPPMSQSMQSTSTLPPAAGTTAAAAAAGPEGPSQHQGGAAAEYPYRAKAIYSYEANPDDANEISFSKHEILEVSDVSGRWWQAKKETGETGIAPSNYLILL